jgi:aminopeptidase N
MKHLFTFIIVVFFSIAAFTQYSSINDEDMQCSHAKYFGQANPLRSIYNWQSAYLSDYDVTFYFLDITVSDASTYVEGNVTIYANALVALDTFAFELIPDQTIDSILFKGVKYTNFTREDNNVIVPVNAIPQGDSFNSQIFYHGQPPSGGFFSGISNENTGYDNISVTWTLSEPFAASDWFPVKQDLEDKADSAWIFLTTSSDNMAGSEGTLTNIVNLGNGNTRYEWKTTYPIDYYLISFAVADYQEYNTYAHPSEMNGDSILIQNFIYDAPGVLEGNKAGIDATGQMIDTLSELYILYPFSEEKYGHCLTELGGGMEHQTMTTIGGFSFDLVAHELGHMWFGDNVTCATWSDIWINEGFATYSNYLIQEFINGWDAGQSFIVSKQNSAMGSNGSIYIPEDEIYPGNEWRIFNGQLTYNKGASIIHTLRHEIQDDSLFFAVMSTFQTDFTDSTATGEDFKNTAENVTGMDFTQFFDQWYYGKGYPRYNFEWYYDAELSELHITSTQTTTTNTTTLFDMLLDIKLLLIDGTTTTITVHQTDNVNEFVIPIDTPVYDFYSVDPDNWTMEFVDGISVIVEETSSPAYFTIGPNPASDYINVYFLNKTTGGRSLVINDISGRKVFETEIKDNSERINISSLPKGVYTILSSDGNQQVVKRFIK